MKITKWIVIGSALGLLLTGCSDNEKTAKPVNNESKIEKPQQNDAGEKIYPYTFPLTGIGSEVAVDTRAVAVMVNNHPKARPHSGLHKADIVFELLAEGDVTRFLAVFQSEKPEKVGPVRSARDYYIDLAKGLNGLYIAHGYSPEARKMLESGYIDNLNGMVYDGTLFKRSSERKAPHNSYITYENILKGAEKNHFAMNIQPPSYKFYKKNEIESIQGKEAKSVMVSYFSSALFNAIYDYDDTLGRYKRYSNGEQTIDYESKEPVLIDNIMIIEMQHKLLDSVGRREVNLTSGGNGYLLQKGKWNEITWGNVDGQIVPFQNGSEARLVPGKTWINVIPTDKGLQKSVSFEDK
ncbi:DUF3048 domain-containing protein [Bacillus sp. CGMCC 1.16607]|uniref:DUF3048 domain-containing protein n=1 Tax=Bacillus sp. CGMCC 1.16607 TaxID=3351842 RepID=UPI003629F4FA